MRLIPITLLSCLISGGVYSQTLTTSLIHSAGAIQEDNQISVHWAIGELAIVRLQNEITLDQGLYQLDKLATATKEPIISNEVIVYPNPAIDHLLIKGLSALNTSYNIHHISGHQVHKGTINKNAPSIDITSIPAGSYLLRIQSSHGGSKTYKFLKTN